MIINKYVKKFLNEIKSSYDINCITSDVDNDSIDNIINNMVILYKDDNDSCLMKKLLSNKLVRNTIFNKINEN